MLWVLLGGATMLLVCARCNTDTPNILRTWSSLGDDGDDDDDGDDGDDGDDIDDALFELLSITSKLSKPTH